MSLSEPVLADDVLAQLFTEARSHVQWQDRPVSDEQLQALYELAKWGPTSMNCFPMRLKFVRSAAAKARLIPLLAEGNKAKTAAAPATIIVASDHAFHEQLPRLFPAAPAAREMFAGDDALREATAFRNSSLQAGYLIMAARALGLDAGPMSGFDAQKVDQEFFAGTRCRTNLLINIGYGVAEKLYPRGPRPEFGEVAEIL